MKIYNCLFVILIGCVLNISGQKLELDAVKLFEEIARYETIYQGNKNSLINYQNQVAKILSKSKNPEQKAAVLLLELQGANSDEYIKNAFGKAVLNNSPPSRLDAEKLLIEYFKLLTLFCSRENDDPIRQRIDNLSSEGSSERKALYYKLKSIKDSDFEKKFAGWLMAIKEDIEKIGLGNLNQESQFRLFFPLCILSRNGC